jgi:SAM-dependent methyltransferase
MSKNERTNPGLFHGSKQVLRIMALKLKALVDSDLVPPATAVLDFGCGDRPYEDMLRTKFQRYIGADLAGSTGAEILIGTNSILPLPDSSVDAVLSSNVLEHVMDARVYLSECSRVTVPNGLLFLLVPYICSYHPHPTDHLRFTRAGLEVELKRAGFDVVVWDSVLGHSSCALQVWQDATWHKLPRGFARFYVLAIQTAIGILELRSGRARGENAFAFIVLARKSKTSTSSQVAH